MISKLLTTKWPLGAVLMQLSSLLSAQEAWLSLTWVPRESNCEADALTNDVFAGFSEARRIHCSWPLLLASFPVLAASLTAGQALYDELTAAKLERAEGRAEPQPQAPDRRSKRQRPLTDW